MPAPPAGQGSQGDGGDLRDRDRDPVPTWDGSDPAVNLKMWLRQLNMWKFETSIPSRKHGSKLFKSLAHGTRAHRAAELVPDEVIMSDRGWDAIIQAIRTT
eukprot:10473861-Prorocentrum_lima.AAC.1